MKVSIVMPAFNVEKTIKTAVDSVLQQSYRNLELIVVDDGSSDCTRRILEDIKKTDSRLKVITIENSGVSTARNIGIAQCTGEMLAFVDSDDTMQTNMIEVMVDQCGDDIDLVCCGYMVVSHNGEKLFSQSLEESKWSVKAAYKGIAEMQKKKAFNVLWNKLFRLDLVKTNNITMNPEVKMGEDFLFVVDYFSVMSRNMKCISDVLYNYSLSPNGAQARLNDDQSLIRRLDQLDKLKEMYDNRDYPLDSFYSEQLRCIYTAFVEANDCGSVLKIIKKDARFNELKRYFRPSNMKDKIFYMVLKSQNKMLITCMIKLFNFLKKKSGRSYKW
ncbi:MAG: glycosyltransferase family 2 protein [Firmicutes bacterium]|nr:glycosyltransferase family 2 protein [Bacillota bacterium]